METEDTKNKHQQYEKNIVPKLHLPNSCGVVDSRPKNEVKANSTKKVTGAQHQSKKFRFFKLNFSSLFIRQTGNRKQKIRKNKSLRGTEWWMWDSKVGRQKKSSELVQCTIKTKYKNYLPIGNVFDLYNDIKQKN